MSQLPPLDLNEFQREVLSALRRLTEEHGYEVENEHFYSYPDGDSPAFDIGGVPIEVAPDQATIATRHNAKIFELGRYSDSRRLVADFIRFVRLYAEDPLQMRHPAVRVAHKLREWLSVGR